MWCFGKCLRRTEFNTVGTNYWNNICHGARDYDGEEMCKKFGTIGVTAVNNGMSQRSAASVTRIQYL